MIILCDVCNKVRPCDLYLQAGHPFQQRCAQSAYSNGKPRSEAPVFLLFLDCVWQILRQFPCSFQFSENFLIMLFEHAYASQFGTFLGNRVAERSVFTSIYRFNLISSTSSCTVCFYNPRYSTPNSLLDNTGPVPNATLTVSFSCVDLWGVAFRIWPYFALDVCM